MLVVIVAIAILVVTTVVVFIVGHRPGQALSAPAACPRQTSIWPWNVLGGLNHAETRLNHAETNTLSFVIFAGKIGERGGGTFCTVRRLGGTHVAHLILCVSSAAHVMLILVLCARFYARMSLI